MEQKVLILILYFAVALLFYLHFVNDNGSDHSSNEGTVDQWQIISDKVSENIYSRLRREKDSGKTVQAQQNNLNYAPILPVDAQLCKTRKLYGNDHHGGWIVCEDMISTMDKGKCLVYSYGLGADWSFDKALEHVGCELHGFDPSGECSNISRFLIGSSQQVCVHIKARIGVMECMGRIIRGLIMRGSIQASSNVFITGDWVVR